MISLFSSDSNSYTSDSSVEFTGEESEESEESEEFEEFEEYEEGELEGEEYEITTNFSITGKDLNK